METYPVYFHPEAIAEASAAFHWYQERSFSAAKAFISELDRIVLRKLLRHRESIPFTSKTLVMPFFTVFHLVLFIGIPPKE